MAAGRRREVGATGREGRGKEGRGGAGPAFGSEDLETGSHCPVGVRSRKLGSRPSRAPRGADRSRKSLSCLRVRTQGRSRLRRYGCPAPELEVHRREQGYVHPGAPGAFFEGLFLAQEPPEHFESWGGVLKNAIQHARYGGAVLEDRHAGKPFEYLPKDTIEAIQPHVEVEGDG